MNNQNLKDIEESLENILYIFSEFYKYPEDSFIDEINSGQIDEHLKELFAKVQFNFKPNVREKVQTGKTFKEQYHYSFSGVVTPFVLPVESVYKQWTTDPSAMLGIAKQKGYLMGDSAIHMRHLYEKFGVSIPKEYEFMPDHLTLQLEFLALLQKNKAIDEGKQFIDDHLDWLPDMSAELKYVDDGAFYLYITELLQRFLEYYRHDILTEIGERSESFYV